MSTRGHHWVLWTALSRQFCCTCGLLWLRNDTSNRAAKKPCPGKVDDVPR